MFKDVNFGNPKDSSKFYSHLFYLPEDDYWGETPKSSIFHLETLKLVFDRFNQIPDFIETPDVDIDEYIPKLQQITETLMLDNNYQTYLFGLYLKYVVNLTGMRSDVGGSKISTFV